MKKTLIITFIVLNFLLYAEAVELPKEYFKADLNEKAVMLDTLYENQEVRKHVLAQADSLWRNVPGSLSDENYYKITTILLDDFYGKREYKKILDLAQESLQNLVSQDYKKDIYLYLIFSSRALQDNAATLNYINQYLNLFAPFESLEALKDKSTLLNLKSMIYLKLGSYAKALEISYENLQLTNELEEINLQAQVLSNIGNINWRLHSYDDAVKYFEKALEKVELLNDQNFKAGLYNNIANVYADDKKFEKALEFYNKAIEINKKNTVKLEMGTNFYNIATVYRDKKDFNQAIIYLQKALHYNQDDDLIKKSNLVFLQIYTAKRQFDKAKPYAEFIRANLNRYKDKYFELKAYFALQEYFYNVGEMEAAYKSLMAYNNKYKDIFNSEVSSKVSNLKTIQYSELREEENIKLKKTNQLNKVYIILLLFILACFIVFLILLIKVSISNRRNMRELRFKNNEIKEQNEKLNNAVNDRDRAMKKFQEEHKKLLELEKKNTALAMAVTASHELNQPLTVLRGNIEMLEAFSDIESFNEKQLKYLDKIKVSLDKIEKISHKYRTTKDFKVEKYSEKTDMLVFENEDKE